MIYLTEIFFCKNLLNNNRQVSITTLSLAHFSPSLVQRHDKKAVCGKDSRGIV